MIKWPEWAGALPAHDNVGHYDVMPSILDLIGLEPKFYESLSGQSLLRYREDPREVVISTVHRGETGIGLCLIRGERKVKFSFAGCKFELSASQVDHPHLTVYLRFR